jgi:hypothetical protein
MIATVSHHLTRESIWHTAADGTLTIHVTDGMIVVLATQYGVTVYYPGGQYTAFSAADVVNHVLWLLSDEFDLTDEAGDATPLPKARGVSVPFLTCMITVCLLLALVAGMM